MNGTGPTTQEIASVAYGDSIRNERALKDLTARVAAIEALLGIDPYEGRP